MKSTTKSNPLFFFAKLKRTLCKRSYLYLLLSPPLLVILQFPQLPAIALQKFHVISEPKVTEIYFSNHTELPKFYKPQKQFLVPFVVHNFEGEQVSYEYRIIQTNAQTKRIVTLKSGHVKIDDQKLAQINISLRPDDLGGKSRITVILTFMRSEGEARHQQVQSIDFWVHKEGTIHG